MKGVLFLCTGNSCRSQIAEVLGRAMAPEGVAVFSAGTDPVGVNPRAITVLREAGFDLEGQTSNGLDAVPLDRVDTLITLCGSARETCPTLPGIATKIHWPLEDPADATGTEEEILAVFRATREEIRRRMADLFESDR